MPRIISPNQLRLRRFIEDTISGLTRPNGDHYARSTIKFHSAEIAKFLNYYGINSIQDLKNCNSIPVYRYLNHEFGARAFQRTMAVCGVSILDEAASLLRPRNSTPSPHHYRNLAFQMAETTFSLHGWDTTPRPDKPVDLLAFGPKGEVLAVAVRYRALRRNERMELGYPFSLTESLQGWMPEVAKGGLAFLTILKRKKQAPPRIVMNITRVDDMEGVLEKHVGKYSHYDVPLVIEGPKRGFAAGAFLTSVQVTGEEMGS